MLGTGLGQFVPIVVYLAFWIMCIVSLTGKPLMGLYYMIPFIPYRTLRDKFADYPLGGNALTILVIAVIIGALIHGKSLPKSKLYAIWLAFGGYLYFSMWIGTAFGLAPAPLWLSDANFVAWKDYMLIPLIFLAAGLVIEDRKSIRMVVLLTAISLLIIDRSCILESMSRTWATFDENKRSGGPLAYGSNQTAAYLAQFAMFVWGLVVSIKAKKFKIAGYALVAATIFATMYTFSRGGYLAVLFGVLILGLLKDRKLLLILGVVLLTWQTIVPTAVRERITMTKDANGQLEASAQERVLLWQDAQDSFFRSPIVGTGFATFQFGDHVDELKDTHNWFVKVIVETGVLGLLIVLLLLQQAFATSYRLFKQSTDPLYRGLGLGLFLALCTSMVANCFGDRWTYLEITGQLWLLVGAGVRALQLTALETTAETSPVASTPKNPYLAYR